MSLVRHSATIAMMGVSLTLMDGDAMAQFVPEMRAAGGWRASSAPARNCKSYALRG